MRLSSKSLMAANELTPAEKTYWHKQIVWREMNFLAINLIVTEMLWTN